MPSRLLLSSNNLDFFKFEGFANQSVISWSPRKSGWAKIGLNVAI